MSITYRRLAKHSLKVLRDWLRLRSPSTFAWRASASSTNSDMTGSRNPRPCGASGFCSERERAKSDPCDIRLKGVRWGVWDTIMMCEITRQERKGLRSSLQSSDTNPCLALSPCFTRSCDRGIFCNPANFPSPFVYLDLRRSRPYHKGWLYSKGICIHNAPFRP